MKHGVTTIQSLHGVCQDIGQSFQDEALGDLLWEICHLETKGGLVSSRTNGGDGVCGINMTRYSMMINHHKIYDSANSVFERFGFRMRQARFGYFAYNPTLSLIFVAAWFRCYVDTIPKSPAQRAALVNRYWSSVTEARYLKLIADSKAALVV